MIEADAVHAAGTSFGVNIVSSLNATGGWTNLATPPDRGLAMIRYRGDLILGHLTGIALWSNSAWTNFDGGPVGAVYSLAVLNDQLYAGGLFNTVGTSVANNIARWDGTNWNPLAGGVNALVHTLAVSGDRLFVGGDFTAAGGVEALSVAQWSQKSGWAPLGAGLTGGQGTTRVYSLKATVDGKLFAGGTFTSSGSNLVNYIAMWNGEDWLPLGSGVNDHVYSVDISGADLFVGGRFTRAGNHSSLAFGRWRIPQSLGLAIAAPNAGEPFLNVTGEPGTTIVVDESSNLEEWTPITTNSLVLESTPVSITSGFSARFYRLRLVP